MFHLEKKRGGGKEIIEMNTGRLASPAIGEKSDSQSPKGNHLFPPGGEASHLL